MRRYGNLFVLCAVAAAGILVGSLLNPRGGRISAAPPAEAEKWEYRVGYTVLTRNSDDDPAAFAASYEATINTKYGQEGWELVGPVGYYHDMGNPGRTYLAFKRRVR